MRKREFNSSFFPLSRGGTKTIALRAAPPNRVENTLTGVAAC